MPNVRRILRDPGSHTAQQLVRRIQEEQQELRVGAGQRGRKRVYPMAKVGDKFGEWTVIAYWLPDVEHHFARRIVVKCSCGFWRIHRENLLVRGLSKSCGHANAGAGLRLAPRARGELQKQRLKEVYAKLDALVINIRRTV